MNLVDADRRRERLAFGAMIDPLLVSPGVLFEVPHHGAGAWPQLGGESERIGLVDAGGREARLDTVLVESALADARYKALPDARRRAIAQRRGFGVPVVEFANNADFIGVRCPNGEGDAELSVDLDYMG